MNISKKKAFFFSVLIAAIGFSIYWVIQIAFSPLARIKFSLMRVDYTVLQRLNSNPDVKSLTFKSQAIGDSVFLFAEVKTQAGTISTAYNGLIIPDPEKRVRTYSGAFILSDDSTSIGQNQRLVNYNTNVKYFTLTPAGIYNGNYVFYDISLFKADGTSIAKPTDPVLLKYFVLNPCPPATPPL